MYTTAILRQIDKLTMSGTGVRPVLSAHYLRRLVANVRSLLEGTGPAAARADLMHQVLRLDIVAGLGQTPAAYGWRVDDELQMQIQFPGEPFLAAFDSPSTSPENEPPQRGVAVTRYRVPRTRRWAPQLVTLSSGR